MSSFYVKDLSICAFSLPHWAPTSVGLYPSGSAVRWMPPRREFVLTFRSWVGQRCGATFSLVWWEEIPASPQVRRRRIPCPLAQPSQAWFHQWGLGQHVCQPDWIYGWYFKKNQTNKPKHLLLTCCILKSPWAAEPASHPTLKALQEGGLCRDWVGNMGIKGFPGNM